MHLTRNQETRKSSGVRIPHHPPNIKEKGKMHKDILNFKVVYDAMKSGSDLHKNEDFEYFKKKAEIVSGVDLPAFENIDNIRRVNDNLIVETII